jgi:hypothetical protein
VWALTIAMAAVFIKELVLNAQQQGTPFSFKVSVERAWPFLRLTLRSL